MTTFAKKYKRALIGSLLFSFVCFGFMLTHFTLCIDDETWILASEPSALWILQGRFAIWLFDLIFTSNGNFAPFLWDFLAIVGWNISGMIFAYALLEKPKEWQVFFFCAYYSSLPFVVGEIMAFSMFDLQVSTAMIATAVSFVLSRRFLKQRRKKDAVCAMLCLFYGIATFQAMICVYVTAVAAECLLHYLSVCRSLRKGALYADRQALQDETKMGTGDPAKRAENSAQCSLKCTILTCAAICAMAVAVYYVINVILGRLVGSAGYLGDNYNGWASGDWKLAAAMAVANIGRVSFAIPFQGEYIYGGSVIRVLSILFVICAVYLFARQKGWKKKAGILFYTVALCVAPFVLYLALATYKTHGRMLLALPLTGAVQMYVITQTITKPLLKKAMVVLGSYLLFLNARNMNLIYYYSSIAYEKDCTTAGQIMYDIQAAGMDYHEKPVAFIGMVAQDELPVLESCTLGGSFFAWDDGNNSRMCDFLQTRGYAVQQADGQQIAAALEQTKTMNTWPQEGSIAELKDVIVVYLSEPTEKWYAVNVGA